MQPSAVRSAHTFAHLRLHNHFTNAWQLLPAASKEGTPYEDDYVHILDREARWFEGVVKESIC